MERKIPSAKCDGCRRLVNGGFSARCRKCAWRYSPEYVNKVRVYKFGAAVLTVSEWAEIAGCTPRALYAQLENAHYDLTEALTRMGLYSIVRAKVEGWRK